MKGKPTQQSFFKLPLFIDSVPSILSSTQYPYSNPQTVVFEFFTLSCSPEVPNLGDICVSGKIHLMLREQRSY